MFTGRFLAAPFFNTLIFIMKIPLYIIEEMVIRLQEFNPAIGDFTGNERLGSQMIVKTTNGIITVPVLLLSKQLYDPGVITKQEIAELSKDIIGTATT